MANVNDSRGVQDALERVVAEIETADVDEADREALLDYARWKRRRAGSANTARIYIRDVTLSAERHDVPLTDVDGIGEVDRIIEAHERAGCKKANSVNLKLTALRDFWRWCESVDHGQDDYRWVEMIRDVSASEENPGPEQVDPAFVLSEQEIVELREAATNLRDKALIEFLADTGARITLATQMRRGGVNIERTPPTFRPNPNGIAHKDVPTKEYVLHESSRHIRRYLNEEHPDDADDAPLFALLRGYDPSDRENGALSPKSATSRLKKAAEAAGIDRDRAHPHNFRRAAVVRMRLKHDMSWDAIQKRTAWSDQSLAHMKAVYRRIDNSEEIDLVARELGYAEPEDDAGAETSTECWNCGSELSIHDKACPDCGMRQDQDPMEARLGEALSRLAREDPDLAREVITAANLAGDD